MTKDKKELTLKIGVLDQEEENGRLTDLQWEVRLENAVKLSSISVLEARKWFAREKQNQFKWGDSNTSYFYNIINSRRRRNTIAKLEIDGVDCFDQEVIKEEMRNYFVSLFTEENDVAFTMNNLHFPVIEEDLKFWMEREFSKEEVFDVIKKMGNNKSPGPDGFSLEFYKKCWHIIKEDFMKMMVEFHTYGSWDWRLNSYFLTLIPKKEDTCSPRDFRPLSLLGSAYKILSKIFSNRLKVAMPVLVSDFQGAFIKEK